MIVLSTKSFPGPHLVNVEVRGVEPRSVEISAVASPSAVGRKFRSSGSANGLIADLASKSFAAAPGWQRRHPTLRRLDQAR